MGDRGWQGWEEGSEELEGRVFVSPMMRKPANVITSSKEKSKPH